jgi:hypothetical protein
MNKESAIKHIEDTCGHGWLNLVDIVFDNKPKNIHITEVFQKYAGLKIRYEGENEHFQELTDMTYYMSQKMCEICGSSGNYTIMAGWETTLCNQHFEESGSKEKYRKEK